MCGRPSRYRTTSVRDSKELDMDMKKNLLTVFAAAAVLAGCGSSADNFVFTAQSNGQGQQQPAVTRQQVEFLARPAIGEGLLFTNDFLNTYNAVTPAFVAAALADPSSEAGLAAAPIFAEAIAVLDLLEGVDGDNTNGLTTAQIVGAFLPDVMRIDTTLNVAVADSSYAAAANSRGSVVGGRKLTDDVVDITLTVLTDGFVTTDNVPYYRPAGGDGSTNQSIGHQRLNGQAADFGPATFPFLAPPN